MGIVIPFHVHLFGEGYYIERTSHNTQVAAFATLGVYYDCSFDFCHNLRFLLIVHILVIEVQNIHYHVIGLPGGAVRIEVDGIAVVVQRLLPVALFAVCVPPEIIGFVFLREIGLKQFVKQQNGLLYVSLTDKLFYGV